MLVIEGDEELRALLGEHLRTLGCRVLLARDEREASRRWGEEPAPVCAVLADSAGWAAGAGCPSDTGHAGHGSAQILDMSPTDACPRASGHLAKPFSARELNRSIARLCRGGPARYRALGLPEPDGGAVGSRNG